MLCSSILGRTREAKVKTKLVLLVLALIALPIFVMADAIPYPNIGTQAPVTTFTATTSGEIIAYFYSSDAGYNSEIGLLVNNLSTGVQGLPNHASAHGQQLDLGFANAGDTLVFELFVLSTGEKWFSDPSMNSDGFNHVYSTSFSGDSAIPAGTYVAFEDIAGGGDVDYNDHQFVFTNVTRSTPEPASALLLAGGLGLLGAWRKRNK